MQIQEQVLAVISEMNRVAGVKSVQDLKKEEVKEIAIGKLREQHQLAPQGELL